VQETEGRLQVLVECMQRFTIERILARRHRSAPASFTSPSRSASRPTR